jgi:hypothetical protein
VKHLVTFRRRDGVPVPPDAISHLLVAQRDWIQQHIDDGTIDVAYTFAQGGGGIGIVNASSGEELSRLLSSSPLFGVSSIELQPLTDISALESFSQAVRSVAVPV